MFDLTVSCSIFLFFVGLHLGICRREKKDFLLIKKFLFMSVLGLPIFWKTSFLFHYNPPLEIHSVWHLPLPVTSTLLYILLTLIYLSFYVNVKLVSPSKKIVTLIREHKGMTYSELLKHFTDPGFIQPRLDDLVKSGCAQIKENRYCLSPSGRRIGKILEIYQKILGRPKGG